MSKALFVLIVPLVLSAFIHLWNPTGFPTAHNDEDAHYIPRALMFMKYGDPQKQNPGFYDHPFFGQILLGTIFKVIGYPDAFITNNGNVESVSILYMVPRVIMGLLAVLDTFIIYKIADVYYGRKVAFISSILFAVMPITWLLRWILLDNLLLPFLLSSLMFAIYATKGKDKTIPERTVSKIQIVFVTLSGILLGLAIFTKIPAFTVIPLFVIVLYSNLRNKRMIALWLAPVILIPLIWPLYAISANNFDMWVAGVLWQAGERIDKPLISSILSFLEIDPVLLILGLSGLAYTILRKDYLILLWVIPFIGLTLLVHYVSLFHLVFILPPLCIAGAKLIYDTYNKLKNIRARQIISVSTISAIIIFGIATSFTLISMNLSSAFFEAVAFTNNYLPKVDAGKSSEDNKVTVIGPIRFSWVASYVLGKTEHSYKSLESNPFPITTKKILFINPTGEISGLLSNNPEKSKWLSYIYNNTRVVAVFVPDLGFLPSNNIYPYTSLKESPPHSLKIEIRANF